MDAPLLIDKLDELLCFETDIDALGQLYMMVHAENRRNSCHHVHEEWRQQYPFSWAQVRILCDQAAAAVKTTSEEQQCVEKIRLMLQQIP